ncbi:MAG TPA: tyrosine-type recombinase/integrase [Gemmatimonadales bacterium]|nr:tyrosine-type recombinase/integrase [Gemmatimonadales bacterium]
MSRKPFIRRRGQVWWGRYQDAAGKLRDVSLETKDEAEARAVLRAMERRVAAEREIMEAAGTAAPVQGPLTVATYAVTWFKRREAAGIATWRDERTRLERHALPFGAAPGRKLGAMSIQDVEPRHVLALVRDLRGRIGQPGGLSPRSVRHVYAHLRQMFGEAVTDGLLRTNPINVPKRELPVKTDSDPAWRDAAVYTLAEVRALISDQRIPEWRRVLWAALFLTGMRVGEWAGRRWRDLEPADPLSRLVVASAYRRKAGREGATKTGVTRWVPVHPELAAMLERWRARAWAAGHGRAPTADDLISPSPTGKHLRDPNVLEWLHADCAVLGFRARRTHDARRTFISAVAAAGVPELHQKWVTHGPRRGTILGAYTTLPWETLCAAVLAIRLPGQPRVVRDSVSRVTPQGNEAPLSPRGDSGLVLYGALWHPRAAKCAELCAMERQGARKVRVRIPPWALRRGPQALRLAGLFLAVRHCHRDCHRAPSEGVGLRLVRTGTERELVRCAGKLIAGLDWSRLLSSIRRAA